MNSSTQQGTRVSLDPSDMESSSIADMTLDQVIEVGETEHDRPNRHRGDHEESDLRWESVRTRVMGLALENRRLSLEHSIKQTSLIQRLEGKHGLAIMQADPRFQQAEAEYDALSDLVNRGKGGDKAVELLEADGRVRYIRGHGPGTKVTRISCFRWVSGAVAQDAPVLGLSHGQLYLACCILSLSTHPNLTVWGKKAIGEEAKGIWIQVEERIATLKGHQLTIHTLG